MKYLFLNYCRSRPYLGNIYIYIYIFAAMGGHFQSEKNIDPPHNICRWVEHEIEVLQMDKMQMRGDYRWV